MLCYSTFCVFTGYTIDCRLLLLTTKKSVQNNTSPLLYPYPFQHIWKARPIESKVSLQTPTASLHPTHAFTWFNVHIPFNLKWSVTPCSSVSVTPSSSVSVTPSSSVCFRLFPCAKSHWEHREELNRSCSVVSCLFRRRLRQKQALWSFDTSRAPL